MKFVRWSKTAAFLFLVVLGNSRNAGAQVTITEINPNQSTPGGDPDAASGGRINHIATVRNNNQIFYAASEWGGLYKSSDGGHSWSHLNSHLPTVTWDVKVDPNDINRVYATSFYDGKVNSLAGINVSADGGNTWTHPSTATPPLNFCLDSSRRDEPSAFGIAVDPETSYVYVGTNCGLAVSSDRGTTWRYIDPTPANPADDVWDVIVHNAGIIDICGDDGHRRSTDGGVTWNGPTGVPLPSGACSLAVSPDESYVLFAVAGLSIFESDDGGASWPTSFSNRTPQGRIPFVHTNRRTNNNFDLWFGDVSLFRATCVTTLPPTGNPRCPASSSWTGPFTRTVGGHDDTGDIVFDTQAAADRCPVLFSSDGGIYVNTINASPACQSPTWTQPTITPHGLWLFGMAGANETTNTNKDLYFVSQDDGSFATTDSDSNNPAWSNVDCCDGFDVSADANRVLYSSCCWIPAPTDRLILRGPGMTGGGFIPNPPPGNLAGWEYPDILDRFGPDEYVVVSSNGVYITTNIGANPIVWTQLGAATTPFAACAVRAAGPANNPTFYVLAAGWRCSGNQANTLWSYTGVTATGAWQQINPPGGQGGFGIFAVDRSNPNRIFVSYLGPNGPQMMRSNNAGGAWVAVPTLDTLMTRNGTFRYQNQIGPADFTSLSGYVQPTLLAFDPGTNNIVAGGSDSGVFLSTNDGNTWSTLTDSSGTASNPVLPRPHFAYVDHRSGGLFDIYVGTVGRGVWRLTTGPLLNPPTNVNVIVN